MLDVTTETTTGASCSGSSRDLNRVLTLSNTGQTAQPGFLVYVSGLALAITSEYTVSHNSTGTEITFLNPLTDTMTIVVNYYQKRTTVTEYETKRDDVESIITENGYACVLIRQTETVASMGEVTSVSEETYNIWALIQDITRKDRQIHEMGLAVPGNSKAFFFWEYPDSITGNGDIQVETGDIIQYTDSKRWRIEQIISQHQADNNEIFRAAIIKKIDLDEDVT
ncbi:hypothetical protein KAR91_07040 [Candidatus Pacearchaeota archaeon]|nr:hypothetical protein [Candidatus Pacearchaeota archaeon]